MYMCTLGTFNNVTVHACNIKLDDVLKVLWVLSELDAVNVLSVCLITL